ncbi:MAG: hypothetical protein HYU65_04905 [Armatimonadetes bacterium]|nr:hypothetical protein [Armatimonadota bacterium]
MRKSLAMFLAIALVLTLVLPMTAFADKGKGKGKGLSVRGKIKVEGVVTGVSPGASMFTMRVTKHASRAGSGNLVVLVQRATELKVRHNDDDDDDEDEHARRIASINDLRVGDRVQLEGFRLDDGRILALKLDIKNRRIAGPPEPEGVVAQGVVSAKGANTLAVVGSDGVTRIVLVTAATDIRGRRNSFAEIQPTDVVVVQGTVNADGTVLARRIEVVFAGGTQMSGVITAKSSVGPQFLIMNNSIAVNVSGDTRIISGGFLRSFNDLQVGQTITVSGEPVRIGGVTVGINARVITF